MIEIRHTNKSQNNATREAYNEIYNGKGILLRDSFYLWLIDLLKPTPGKLLLDISCGEGRLPVLAQNKGLKVAGLDFAFAGLRKVAHQAKDVVWITGDGEKLPFKDQFADYVTHVGSLEHYMNPERGVREIARVLKPDGKACVFVPNSFGVLGNIKHVWLTGDVFDDGQPLQRYASRRQWETLLEDNGLNIEKTVGYGEIEPPRTRQDLMWMIRKPQKLLRAVLVLAIPTNLANHFAFICTRA